MSLRRPRPCTLLRTGHDYGGEPDAWPHVSSSFGSIDYAGFAKPAASWFRSWWLYETPASDPSRPPLSVAAVASAKIVESWAPSANGTRTIHIYTNAPLARLRLPSGAVFGPSVAVNAFGAPATFFGVPFSPGVLVAEALAADGATVLATDSAASWGVPAALRVSIDAPSASTGTGGAVLLDGTDVALLRATVVDAAGNTCGDATTTVRFTVTAGPARIVGTHNGDPALQQPANASAVPAYGGLARAVVRVTLAAVGAAVDRSLLAAVNLDAGRGDSSAIAQGDAPPPASFTVTATADGIAAGSATVSLSVDPEDAVLAVAAASVIF